METRCEITFDNNSSSVFHGGEILSGSAQLVTQKQKTIRAIYITLEGYASVHWQETQSRRVNDKTEYYTEDFRAHDQYLRSRSYVLGSEDGDPFQLVPGTYSHNFQVALPAQLPSSFEGEYGHVRYQVVVTIDRPWRFDNIFKKPFTVLYSLDLNRGDSSYKRPIGIEDEQAFCCFCCRAGNATARLDVPFSGYAPGQKIPIVFTVHNESDIDFHAIRVALIQEVTFTSDIPHHQTRLYSKKIAETNLPSVLRFCKKKLTGFILLPSIPSSSLGSCRIIRIVYSLTAEINTPGCYSDFKLTSPITIGSVPLYQSATNRANVITIQPTAPNLSPDGENDDSPPDYSSIAPPTYEEATEGGKMFTPHNEDKHIKVEPYVPKYPVYYNFATAPVLESSSAAEVSALQVSPAERTDNET